MTRTICGRPNRRRLNVLNAMSAIIACVSFSLAAAEEAAPKALPQSPLSPEETLREFVLHPALRIELVAAEPEVIDPVAIRFDENGLMWVVEMRDYPNGPKPGSPPMSRIKVLEDRDGDGHYETAHVFADKLLFATGIQPWKGGVVVTLAGKVEFLRDIDGDFRADLRETWFTGFAEQNPQLRANHPTFALDNHIYVANGLRGGDVIATRKKWAGNAKPLSISGRDFRFNPNTGTFEGVSGVGQFGLAFDDFGNRFICSNRNPCMHVVLNDGDIKRNPNLAVSSVIHNVSPSGEGSRVFPISRTWTTSTTHEGQFTAACGVTVYRGDLLPKEFRGNSFTCEPTGNMVHRDVLQPDGATFSSRPGREKVEFLATRDEWFRAVNLANGPDGALYVIDMYRAVIEHPQWVPDELKKRRDLRYGDDRGRIYRIVPADKTAERRVPIALSTVSTVELVKLLKHTNAWHRETAARLIFERQDEAAVKPLRKLVTEGSTATSRLHALWALDGLGKLTITSLAAALRDKHPRVAEPAVRLIDERHFNDASIRDNLLGLADSDDARLRFQVALALGKLQGKTPRPAIVRMLAGIAVRAPNDRWTRIAVASSVVHRPGDLLHEIVQHVIASKQDAQAEFDELLQETAQLIASRGDPQEIAAALFQFTRDVRLNGKFDSPRFAILGGLGRGMTRRGKSLRSLIGKLQQSQQDELNALFQRAAELAANTDALAKQRPQAVELLRYANFADVGPQLRRLASAHFERSLRLAAIDTLAVFHAPEIGPFLFDDFNAQSPAVRRAILDAQLADVSRTQLLLNEIESGRIRATELDPVRANRLRKHRNTGIRTKAAQLLAAAVPADRKEILVKYQSALSLEADAIRGRQVFIKNCTACHRIGKDGVNVAPDIADSRTKKSAQLLLNILDPNRVVDSNYFSYTVVTTLGKVVTGLMTSETSNSVTVKQQEGKSATILRRDIERLQSNGVSLMPAGLEKNINVQQMADLISFIKNWRYLDGRIPIDVD